MPQAKTSRGAVPLERCSNRALFPLSMNQRDMWFQGQIHAQKGLNNVCVQVNLEGALNVEFFRRAWQAVVDRHEALRTVFVEVDSVPQQKILSHVEVDFFLQDLSENPPAEQAGHLELIARELVSRQFDFSVGPLLRFSLLRFDQKHHVCLFVFSHLILDGIYMSQIFEQVRISYESLLGGGNGSLSPLEIQYPDFAVRQNELLSQGILRHHEAYWQEQLGGTLPEMELPTDRHSRQVTSFDLGVLD